MGELTEKNIKQIATDVLQKVVEAHNLSQRIAEALSNAVEINLWRKILTGKEEEIHIDFRLSFHGVKMNEIGNDGEMKVTMFELVDGKPVTELFSQSLLKALIKDGRVDASVEVTELLAKTIETGKVKVDELGKALVEATDAAKMVEAAEEGKKVRAKIIIKSKKEEEE